MRKVDIARAIFDEKEIKAVVDCLKKGWLGAGKITEAVEKRFSKYIGVRFSSLVNSGSSANLLAIRALNLPPKSKVLACAAGFPSTLNPIWHSHLTPIVVDIDLQTLNIDLDKVEEALKKHPDIKAIIFAHTAGIPVDMKRINRLARKYKLKVIEDNCDALGSAIYGKKTGSWGDLSTCSFYASHHLTAGGGGGMISTKNEEYAIRIKEMKEWGKKQITLGFEKDHGVWFDETVNVDGEKVPYDHRYSYPQIGYNFKLPEMNAAFLNIQMGRLKNFVSKRKRNYAFLRRKMEKFADYFLYPRVPHKSADPSWFLFPMTLKENVGFTRKDITEFLEQNGVKTRLFFAGNILLHKGYKNLVVEVVGDLDNANKVTKDSFMVGIHPAQTNGDLDYIVETFTRFFESKTKHTNIYVPY